MSIAHGVAVSLFALLHASASNAQEMTGRKSQDDSLRPVIHEGGSPESSNDNAENGLQDIVVTAQRRSESMQRVPIAISAVTSAQLETQGIIGLANIQTAVPGLSVQSVGGYLATHLRGIGSVATGPGFENPIALYVDGVYYANQTIGLAGFNNISRIEVLKGPQGTLFGRNATGGLLQIITKDPGASFESNGSFDYGNYDRIEAKLYAGGPVSDVLSADIAIRYADQGNGWGKNVLTGKDVFTVADDLNVRSKVVWAPSDFRFTLIGDYGYRKDTLNTLRGAPGSTVIPGVTVPQPPSRWDVNSNVDQFNISRGGGLSLKGEADLGFATLSNLVAWRQNRFENDIDTDGSPLDLVEILINQKDKQFSNELQLASNGGGSFTWVGGLFYFNASSSADPFVVRNSTNPALNPGFPLTSVFLEGKQKTNSISVYGQATYKITDRLSLTGGLRFSREKRSLDGQVDGLLAVPGAPVINLVPGIETSRVFKQPTLRAALDYRVTDDVLVYASFNTGFKSGGFNVTIPTDPAYLPEKITAYEIGQKADFFNHLVRLNLAAFYYDYRNLQVQIPRAVGTGFENARKAEIYGADIDLTLVPTKGLEISASATLLSSEYKTFPNAPISSPTGGIPVFLGDVSGNRLPYTPNVTSNLSATYTASLGENKLILHGGWLHTARQTFEPDGVDKEESYDLFNASVTYEISDGRYYVAAYGNNLSNELVRSGIQSTPTGPRIEVLQAPRTYGLRIGFKY